MKFKKVKYVVNDAFGTRDIGDCVSAYKLLTFEDNKSLLFHPSDSKINSDGCIAVARHINDDDLKTLNIDMEINYFSEDEDGIEVFTGIEDHWFNLPSTGLSSFVQMLTKLLDSKVKEELYFTAESKRIKSKFTIRDLEKQLKKTMKDIKVGRESNRNKGLQYVLDLIEKNK